MKTSKLLTILSCGLLCVGCSATPSTPSEVQPPQRWSDTAQQVGQLPQLPSDDEVADESSPRSGSALHAFQLDWSTLHTADHPLLMNEYQSPALVSGATASKWAMYHLPDVSAEFYPRQLQVLSELHGADAELWALVSDYSTGRWKPLAAPQTSETATNYVAALDDEPQQWESYASPAGNLYVLLVASNGIVVVHSAFLTTEVAWSLSAPTGLAVEVVSATQLRFTWDDYTDPNADRVQIWQSLPPFSPSRVTSQGGPGSPPVVVGSRQSSETEATMTLNTSSAYRYFITGYSSPHQVNGPASNSVSPEPPDEGE